MDTYHLGQTVRIATGTPFTDVDGDPATPETITLTIEGPDGIDSPYAIGDLTVIGTGDYAIDITPDQAGVWVYRWEGAIGETTAVDEGMFRILRSRQDRG